MSDSSYIKIETRGMVRPLGACDRWIFQRSPRAEMSREMKADLAEGLAQLAANDPQRGRANASHDSEWVDPMAAVLQALEASDSATTARPVATPGRPAFRGFRGWTRR